MPFPSEWAGGAARLLRNAARLTLTGSTTWLPGGSTETTSADDPGASGSTLDKSTQGTGADSVTATVTGSGATMTGSPSASVYLAILAAISDGTNLTPAALNGGAITTTGHAEFQVRTVTAGNTWVQVVVNIGATPPTITDAVGLTWTERAQQQFGGGWITVWSAPILTDVTFAQVALSDSCDSGLGFSLAGLEP